MSATFATFLFELINFLLLVSLLAWLLFKPVRAALQARQDEERQRREALAASAAETERQRAEVQHRLQAFDTEVAAMRQQHVAAAAREAADIRRQAHEVADHERELATQRLSQLERAHVERLSAAVAATARQSIERLLVTLDGPDLEASLVRAATRRVADVNSGMLGTVLIETAHPLGEAARTALAAAFDGHSTAFEFRVAPELGTGIRIVTSRGLIDASGHGLAREAERTLVNLLATDTSEVTT